MRDILLYSSPLLAVRDQHPIHQSGLWEMTFSAINKYVTAKSWACNPFTVCSNALPPSLFNIFNSSKLSRFLFLRCEVLCLCHSQRRWTTGVLLEFLECVCVCACVKVCSVTAIGNFLLTFSGLSEHMLSELSLSLSHTQTHTHALLRIYYKDLSDTIIFIRDVPKLNFSTNNQLFSGISLHFPVHCWLPGLYRPWSLPVLNLLADNWQCEKLND